MTMLWLFLLLVIHSVTGLIDVPNNVTSPCTDQNHLLLAPGVLTSGGSSRACISRFYVDGPARLVINLDTEDGKTSLSWRELPPGKCLMNGKERPIYVQHPCTDQNHLLLAPGVLTSGGSSRACISRFYVDGPARLVINLDTEDGKTSLSWRELPPGDGGCLDVTVPQLPNTKAVLNVQLSYPEAHCSWHTRMAVRIAPGRFITIHTERAKYRPGDIVRIRAFITKADLSPAHGVIDEIWLEGPLGAWEGIRSAQWLRTKIRLGVAQVQHELDDLAPGGRWTVRAKMADGAQGSSTFLVGDYELPPFQLSVKHSPRVLRSSERLVWNVCVRYPWTEAVEGMLVIRLRGAGSSSSLDSSPGIRTAVRLKAPTACHRHAAASRRIGLNGINPPDVVVADFSFQEEGTRVWQNTTVVSQVVDKLISLEFMSKDRVIIAPGLPYKLKVKAIRFDDKPSINVPLRICHQATNTNDISNIIPTPDAGELPSICENSITDGKGVARIMFTAVDGQRFYKFQAFLSNDTTTASAPFLITVQSSSASAAFGPIKIDRSSTKSFVPLFLKVEGDMAVTVHFVVITRGGIIYRWGATTQCPLSTPNEILNVHRHTNCQSPSPLKTITIDPEPLTNTSLSSINSFELTDFHYPRIMLPIKISHQMCPDSHLVAYFYYNGELVTANKHFEMEDCFGTVEANWSPRIVSPGSSASLHISTPGPALCAVTALDYATKWLTPMPTVSGIMMEGLRRLVDGNRNLTEYDVAGDCFLTSDSPYQPVNTHDLLASWLSSAGVRLAGGSVPNRKCDIQSPSSMLDVDNRPRSDFSEAWLWKLVPVNIGGSATISAPAPQSITRYEASVTCLSRAGVAVSTPTALQVFREFFIHLDTAKKLRCGDSTIIKYRIFNYLYEKICVTVNLQSSSHITLELTSEEICINLRSSISRRVVGMAVQNGDASIRVGAKGQRNGAEISDEVLFKITVEPEGVAVHEQKSIMLCGKDNPDSSKSQVTWDWPSITSVPNTESILLWAAGDITAPLLSSSDSLVSLPRGCGEQNLARLATNLVALDQLDPSCTAYATAKMHVARGFTRQLQYVHVSGGFTAFGGSDSTPSTWLTAFAVRYLRRAYKIISPGLPVPPAIEKAEQWLLGQQMENGCFRNEGQVFHRELKGGLTDEGSVASVALTAYVVSSLVQSSIILPSKILKNTIHCLRALPTQKTKNKIYATALITNAIINIKKYEEELMKRNDADMYRKETAGLEGDEDTWQIIELMKVAKRKEDYVWWETESLSTTIEATGLSLSTISSCPPTIQARCEVVGRGAARWLAANMQRGGGFLTTQDTLVALEALAKWSSTQPSHKNLTLTVASGNWLKKLDLLPGVNIPSIIEVPVGKQMKVNVQGTGCVVVQAIRSYNTLSVSGSSSDLTVQVSVHTDGPFDCNGDRCFCAAVVEACALWTEEFPEMAVLEVNLPAGYGADAAKLYTQLNQHSMVRRIELTRSGNKATFYLTSSEVTAGHYCMKVHAVGPQLSTTPASVRILNYYNPISNDTKMYTIPEDCPSPISHENEEYLRSDNLFNKAKSYTDDDPIISQELTFEDLPEGIPLDDPMYDNLAKDNESYTQSDVQSEDTNNKYNKNSYYIDDNNTPVKKEIEYNIEPNNRTPNEMNYRNESTLKYQVKEETQLKNVKNNEVVVKTHEPLNEIENITVKSEINKEESKDTNPGLSDFHEIDSEKDLEVPSGVEGPVPVYMLPPEGFVMPTMNSDVKETYQESRASSTPEPEYMESMRQFYFHHGQHFGYYI